MEHQLGQVGSVVMGFLEGRIESLLEEERTMGMLSSLGSEGWAASGDDQDDQDGDMVNEAIGGSTALRRYRPMLRETGLIMEMEREVMETGLGGWFNRNPEDVLESWSGSNSGVLASQDQVGITLLTTIGSRTLPNLVRVPDNMVHPAVLTSLMEGPV